MNCGLATATSEVKQGPDWLFVAKKESGAQTQDLGKKAVFAQFAQFIVLFSGGGQPETFNLNMLAKYPRNEKRLQLRQ